MLNALVYLMECGYVLPVLDRVGSWTKGVDLSLIRHFTTKVLEMVGPPYSFEFVILMLKIINHVSLSSTTSVHQDYKMVLDPFLEHCATLKEINLQEFPILAEFKLIQ